MCTHLSFLFKNVSLSLKERERRCHFHLFQWIARPLGNRDASDGKEEQNSENVFFTEMYKQKRRWVLNVSHKLRVVSMAIVSLDKKKYNVNWRKSPISFAWSFKRWTLPPTRKRTIQSLLPKCKAMFEWRNFSNYFKPLVDSTRAYRRMKLIRLTRTDRLVVSLHFCSREHWLYRVNLSSLHWQCRRSKHWVIFRSH